MNKKIKVLSAVLVAMILSSQGISYGQEKLIDRVSGGDRYQTSIDSLRYFEKSDTIILASGKNLIDSVIASSLSSILKAPIILVGDELKPEVFRGISPQNILIVGGYDSVKKSIEDDLKIKYRVERISGDDRYQTSKKIGDYARRKFDIKSMVITSGKNITDSLIASFLVSKERSINILVDKENNMNEVKKLSNVLKTYIVGGENSVDKDVERNTNATRISGKDRYQTAKAVYDKYKKDSNGLIVVNSKKIPDSVVAASLSGRLNMGIMFSDDKNIIESVKKGVKTVIIGGEESVEKNIYKDIENIVYGQKNIDTSNPSEYSGVFVDPNSLKVDVPDKNTESMDIPKNFDLRNINGVSYVSNVKNQYYDGGCRSFASISALESHIKMKEGITLDLSENNMETRNGFIYFSRGKRIGVREGRTYISDIPYLISGIGPILENEDPYIPMKHEFNPASYLNEVQINNIKEASNGYLGYDEVQNNYKRPVELNPSRMVLGIEFLKSVESKFVHSINDKEILDIKKSIMENGAVVSNIYMKHDGNNTFPYSNYETYSPDNNAYCVLDKGTNNTNHAISIVGWDDEFKKENFNKNNRPKIDGAWIVKDAQSEAFGEDGYFYVSYQSDGICENPYVFTNVKPKNYYSGIYQNELYGLSGFEPYNYMSDRGSIDKNVLFNRYISNGKLQELKSVGFFTSKPNAEYEIYYIKDFDNYKENIEGKYFDNKELLDAMKKEGKVILSGKMSKAGYHTIDIPDNGNLNIKNGDIFAFGIYIKNDDKEDPDHTQDIAVEKYKSNVLDGYTIDSNRKFEENTSFCLSTYDEGCFEDLKYGKIHPTIKVYYRDID